MGTKGSKKTGTSASGDYDETRREASRPPLARSETTTVEIDHGFIMSRAGLVMTLQVFFYYIISSV